MTPSRIDPSSIETVLKRVIRVIPQKKVQKLLELNILWQRIIGEPVSRQSYFTNIKRNSTICLEVANYAWLQPLNKSKDFILQQIALKSDNRLVFKGIEIVFQPAEGDTQSQTGSAEADRAIQGDSDVLESIKNIDDPDVRESLLKLYFAKLKKS
jgi:hypothetical protein